MLQERTPPTAGFRPTEHESWRGSFVVIDPTEHADGQKIAMERRSDVGEPHAILRSLAKQMALNELPQPFSVQIYAIAEPSSFWLFAEEHDFKIKMITFDVAVPNMFGGADEFTKELRELRKENNVSHVRTTLVSDTVIDTKANNLDEVVDYTEQGAGQIRASTTDGAKYNSQNHAKHDRVETEAGEPDFWSKIYRWAGERF